MVSALAERPAFEIDDVALGDEPKRRPLMELTVERYRRLAADLRTLVAERVRTEREIKALDEAEDAPSRPLLDRDVEALAEDLRRDSAAADERHAAERLQLDARYRSEAAAIEAEYARTANEIHHRHAEELAAAEQQYEENRWMLSSLSDDDAENSPKRRYESLRTQLEQARDGMAGRWEELKAVYDRAVAIVEGRRQRVHPPVEPVPAPRNRAEAGEGFDAAAETIRVNFERLKRQFVPRLFAGWTVVLLALALWGGLFAAGYLLVDPAAVGFKTVKPAGHVVLSGVAALVVCVIAFTILWAVASRQTSRAFDPIQEATAAAQSHHQHWMKFAKEELQRREKEYRDRYQELVERRERSFRRFDEERAQRIRDVNSERDEALREPAWRRESLLRDASERYNRDLLASEATHRRETTGLRTKFERERARLTQELDRRIAERESTRRRLTEQMRTRWTTGLQRIRSEAEEAAGESREAFPDWLALAGADRAPPTEIPEGVRLGDYELDLNRIPGGVPADPALVPAETAFRLPAVLPFPAAPSLVLDASGPAARTAAVGVLQAAMLRLLTQLPPGKVRFTILDPVGLGESFASFMHLADYDDLLISGRIWTEPSQIERQLEDLTAHMESVFQTYLRNEFESIEEYNEQAGEVAEPYRVLVVANFPAGFAERAAQRLASVAASGPKCGVYTLVSYDPQQPMPHGFDPASLEVGATVLRWQAGEFVSDEIDDAPVPLRPDAPPPPQAFAAIVRRAGELSRHVRRVEVPFRRIIPGDDALWTADSRRSIDAPLGRAGATKLQHLRLGTGTSQHVLIAGKTGSGKSTLLHVLVTNLALRYDPNEVEFFLIDFKKGVEFKTYVTHALPHARVVAIESDREFGVSVLERLDAILKARGELFREVGVQDIAAFRDERPGIPMPRILLVVDEFQEFFTEDDRYSQTAALLLDRLVRQGRAFGIHVLLGSQTLGGAYSLARTTVGQMAVRIALQCSEADAHLILSEENTAARLLTRPGEAIYNDANGLPEGNSPFQVAWLGDDERDEALGRVRDLAKRRGVAPTGPVVFEGNVPADPERNAELVKRLESAGEPNREVAGPPSAWLGEAVAITGPTAVTFRRSAGANLLIVGQDPAAAAGMLSACIVSLAAEPRPNGEVERTPPFYLFTDTSEPTRASQWRALTDSVARPVRIVTTNDAGAAVADIAAEVARRREGGSGPPVFVLIDGLSRFRDLRKGDDDFGFGGFDRDEKKTLSPAKAFGEVLRDGPAVGVHAVVWCDTYNNVDRWLGRQLLREFEMRVAFQMGSADSSNLIDSPAASRLGNNRALLYLDERGTTEKFRPYGPPSDAWLAKVRERLRPEAQMPNADDLDIDMWVVT